jgi:hypothetical protein
MKNLFYQKLAFFLAKTILILAITFVSLGGATVSTVRAAAQSSQDNCGQLLADAEAHFRSTLAPDGSVPVTPETQAAAQEYIRVSKLCYGQIESNNSSETFQSDTPSFIDDGGVLLGQQGASAEFALAGKKWGASIFGTTGGTVTYSFMGDDVSMTDEGAGNNVAISSLPNAQACFITDIQTAFAAWQAVSNIKFVQVADSGSAFNALGATGDIRIGAHTFDGVSGTLAHAYFPPPNGNSAAGDIHFDSAENWRCNNTGTDIGVVALHEIGHSIGLNHENTNTIAVMDPYYNANLAGLQSDDINGASMIYGVALLSAPPLNDTIAGAFLTSPIPYSSSVDTTGANQAPDPNDPIVPVECDGKLLNKGDNTVWYKYSPLSNVTLSIDTLGSNYDTYIAVWSGTETSLSFVACDDDTSSTLQSQMILNAQAGVSYYIQVAEYTGIQGDVVDDKPGGSLNFHVTNVLRTGTYDDTDGNWVYSGSWATLNIGGAYSSTLHYTLTVSDSAWFAFSGTQFVLTYTQDTNRANYDVYVDGSKVGRINANGSFLWLRTYTSPVFPAGNHVVEFRNIGGSGIVMDVDAIEIRDTAAPGIGLYDDNDFNWAYSGSWLVYSAAGPHNSSLHYTFAHGDSASFTFSGTQFVLTYTQDTNRGVYDVYVDGSKLARINASGPFQWNRKYFGPSLANSVHVVKLVNAAAGVMDVDAIEVRASAAPGAGPYDDGNANWTYSGPWATLNINGASSSTLHYTFASGASASFLFQGTQFVLTYTQDTNRANYEVYVDGNKIGQINANGIFQWQRSYTSPIFPSGTHVVEFRNAGGGGGVMDIDALQILNTAAPAAGPYEDTHAAWTYTGSWATLNIGGASGSTLHYTFAYGDSAWFTFSGTQFVLTYTQDTNRANYEVYVDGSKVGRINANGSFQWQKTYTSPVFPSGTHVAEFRNVGGSGNIMDIDAIQIPSTAIPSAGTFDDSTVNWMYSGSWAALSINGASSNTLHYTLTAWDAAAFTFSGTKFTLLYTQDTNRADYDVFVDGNYVTTIAARGTFQWKKSYTSPPFSAGTHVVEFRNTGSGGSVMDVDAITIN